MTVIGFILASVLLALAAPHSASAQEDVSIFDGLESSGRVLGLDLADAGSLGVSDPITGDGRRVQVWGLPLAAGTDVQVDLRSEDFDAYLYVTGPGLVPGLSDDDGGPGLNARLCFQADRSGDYRVVVASLGAERGDFEVTAYRNPGGECGGATGDVELTDLTATPVDGRRIAAGERVEGMLSEMGPRWADQPVQGWALEGQAGQSLTIDLRSTDFDAFLRIAGPGLEGALSDDDSAGRCDARVSITFPETGDYVVAVSALSSAGQGRFVLEAMETPGPVVAEPCTAVEDAGPDFSEVPIAGDVGLPGSVSGSMDGASLSVMGRPLQGWTFAGEAGEAVSVTLTSGDFDAYLQLDGPGVGELLSDDDGAEGLNSRICLRLPESGSYTVYAGPLSEAPDGAAYTLQTEAGERAEELCNGEFEVTAGQMLVELLRLDDGGRILEVGDRREDDLTAADPRHPFAETGLRPWRLVGAPGQTVTIDLRSEVFDPVLRIVHAELERELLNDDTGECLNSRITLTLPASGEALLLPGGLDPAAAGSFTIGSSTNPGPLDPNGCPSRFSDEVAVETMLLPEEVLAGVTAPGENTLSPGVEVLASLPPDGSVLVEESVAEAWQLEAVAGDVLVVEVLASDFDPVLYLTGPGLGGVFFDDDSAGSGNSRVEVTVPESGVFLAVVSSYGGSDGSGPYRIRVFRQVSR